VKKLVVRREIQATAFFIQSANAATSHRSMAPVRQQR
jgi:hypothetical protein